MIITFGGNDTIQPGLGDDLICAGDRNDLIVGVPGAVTTGSYVAVLLMTIALILILYWGMRRIRLAQGWEGGPPPARSARRTPSGHAVPGATS